MLDDDETAELRELRARVFGAGADADAAALARWEELEARRVGSGSAGSGRGPGPERGVGDRGDSARTVVDGARMPSPAAARPPVPAIPAEVAAAEFVPSPPGRPSGPTPARRRRPLLLAGAVAGAALALTGSYVAGAARDVLTPQAATSASPSATGPEVLVGTGSVVIDPQTGKFIRTLVTQVPVDERHVRTALDASFDGTDLTLVARLDRINLWWATTADGSTTCLLLDSAETLSSACQDTALVADGIGAGIGDGSGGDIAFWVTPDKAPYVEVAPDLQTLIDEHPQPTPFASRFTKP